MKKTTAALCAVLLLFAFSACGKPDPNTVGEENLRAVVEQAYTLPSAQAKAFEEADPAAVLPGILPVAVMDEIKAAYAPYFCDEESLENFYKRYAYIAPGPTLCVGYGRTTTVASLEVTRPYDDERYEFTMTLAYSGANGEGEGGEITLRGEARRDDAGLLEYWALSELDRGLLYELQGLFAIEGAAAAG